MASWSKFSLKLSGRGPLRPLIAPDDQVGMIVADLELLQRLALAAT